MTVYILMLVATLAGEAYPAPVTLGSEIVVIFDRKADCEAVAEKIAPVVRKMLNKAATLKTERVERKGNDSL